MISTQIECFILLYRLRYGTGREGRREGGIKKCIQSAILFVVFFLSYLFDVTLMGVARNSICLYINLSLLHMQGHC